MEGASPLTRSTCSGGCSEHSLRVATEGQIPSASGSDPVEFEGSVGPALIPLAPIEVRISTLELPQPIVQALSKANVLQFQDERPSRLQRGLASVYELSQLSPEDVSEIATLGPRATAAISKALGKYDLALGTSHAELKGRIGADVPRVRLATGEEYWGYLHEITDGAYAIGRGANRILGMPLRELGEVDPAGLERLERNLLLDQPGGPARPVRTIGELIQCPFNRPSGTDSLYNLLLDHGLCFRMKLSAENRQALALDPIRFDRYHLDEIC